MAQWYVAPNGSANGDGSLDNPWSLERALGSSFLQPATKYDPSKPPSVIQPGNEILLRGGTYVGAFDCQLPAVTIRSYPGEWARIDLGVGKADAPQGATGWVPGGRRFFVWGDGTTLRDLEVFCSEGKRKTSQSGPWPTEVTRAGLTTYGKHIRFIGLVVHDLGGMMSSFTGGEVSDCLIYNCGWLGGDNAHGHGLYSQNVGDRKLIQRNVFAHNFGYGVHCYGTDPKKTGLQNLELDQNISYDNGGAAGVPFSHFPNIFVGGQMEVFNARITNNLTYQRARDGVTRIGYPWGPVNRQIVLDGNYLADGRLAFEKPIIDLTATRNTIIGKIEGAITSLPAGNVVLSTPRGTHVAVVPHAYAPDKAWVAVYNWDGLPVVDVGSVLGLADGQPYALLNIYDRSPVAAGSYRGTVEVSMVERDCPRPQGYSDRSPVRIGKEFAVFLLQRSPVVPPVDPPPVDPPVEPPVDPVDPPPSDVVTYQPIDLSLGSDGHVYVAVNGQRRLVL